MFDFSRFRTSIDKGRLRKRKPFTDQGYTDDITELREVEMHNMMVNLAEMQESEIKKGKRIVRFMPPDYYNDYFTRGQVVIDDYPTPKYTIHDRGLPKGMTKLVKEICIKFVDSEKIIVENIVFHTNPY